MNTRISAQRLALVAILLLHSAAASAQGFNNPALATGAADYVTGEEQLLEKLRDAAPADKAVACKQLAVHGTKKAVPELAKLLADPQLASWSRIALEAIPDPAADAALLKATETLDGRLLVGTINSIGVRRTATAVNHLTGRLKDADAEVASAAAVALGRIASDAATKSLRQTLAGAPPAVRSAVAEGLVLCAERLLANGKSDEAAEIYDEVRKAADVPPQRIVEATRGAILARGADGVPLLVEQLTSDDEDLVEIGLTTARELDGANVADALIAELNRLAPERAALLLSALADRQGFVLSRAVIAAAQRGEPRVRRAAIGVLGRFGDASSVTTLLESATDADAEIAADSHAALVALPGKDVNAEIAARLPQSKGDAQRILIELVGRRRISATAPLVKALDHTDGELRRAALTALGETVGPEELSVVLAQFLQPKHAEDAEAAAKALLAASVRMPDREASAAELAAALPRASAPAQAKLLAILGAMGGPKALETIAAAMKSSDEALQDAGSRVLGEWMNVEAAPVLLDLTKTAGDKFKVRALRGYIRLARQFEMSDAERAAMCQKALEAASRPEEQKLVLAVLERYPSVDTLKVAVNAAKLPGLEEEATRVALTIAQQLGGEGAEALKLLSKLGLDPVKVEIIKAEYGAGATQKDVTEALRQQVRDWPLIALASNYNDSFGGDPAPGTAKELKVRYRINGKSSNASFAENSVILLPMPK